MVGASLKGEGHVVAAEQEIGAVVPTLTPPFSSRSDLSPAEPKTHLISIINFYLGHINKTG